MTTQKQQQQSQLKQLIALGKEQGYLTYAEVNDHLPESITDTDQVEDIIQMINDMGITVVEKAADADQLMIDESADSTDEVAAEEAAAVLASVESEPGRTTDPVRMYMREMGTVELLTREGEIEIAKRIEEGTREVLHALAFWPGAVDMLIDEYARVENEERKLTDIIAGYLDPNDDGAAATNANKEPTFAEKAKKAAEAKEKAKENDDDDDDADDKDSDDDSDEDEGGLDPVLAAERFAELKKLHEKAERALKRNGRDHASTAKAMEALAEHFTLFKLVPRIYDEMLVGARNNLDLVRKFERQIMSSAIRRGGMDRKDFIKLFPGNETNMDWVDQQLKTKKGKTIADKLSVVKEDIQRAQRKITTVEEIIGLPVADIMALGWIIPLPFDISAGVDPDTGQLQFRWAEGLPFAPIEPHHPGQIGAGRPPFQAVQPLKFLNPWRVILPAGWSAAFLHPQNHFELPFRAFSGAVDCDALEVPVNVPFVWQAQSAEAHLPAGTPMVQVVPYERKAMTGAAQVRAESVDEQAARAVAHRRKHSEESIYAREWRRRHERGG